MKVTALNTGGKAWVDFARAIRAITLFGKGFGQILKPSDGSNTLCPYWGEVPKGFGYLAVCITDLLEIARRRGDPESSPIRLVDDICWHQPDKLFDACKCEAVPHKKRFFGRSKLCDRVQVLLPANGSFQKVTLPAVHSDAMHGAVLFGQSGTILSKLKGKEEQEDKSMEVERDALETESQPSDSGLGSSLVSSKLESVADSASSGSSGCIDKGKGKRKAPDEACDDDASGNRGARKRLSTIAGISIPLIQRSEAPSP